jgi:cyclopropane-fatty-acyl-phospholipid synthase
MNTVPDPRGSHLAPPPLESLPRARTNRRPKAPRTLHGHLARLLLGSGVTLDGSQPWDIQVHDSRFYARTIAQGSLGFGDAYVDGWWDTDDLPGCLERLLRHGTENRVGGGLRHLNAARFVLLNLQRGARAWHVGRRHYDLGDDLFEAMLGQRMVYSCGYWAEAADLDAAQVAKLDLVCRKLELEPGMRVLDIGCGWGEALKFAAERYGVNGVGVTISRNQAVTATDLCNGLPVEIRLADYRTLDERFDRIFSIGMFEHVGHRNHGTFFDVVERCLGSQGLCLLHTIGTQTGNRVPDPWIERHIFPNSAIPRLDDVLAALNPHFMIEDLHNFGPDYVRTLEAWRQNFDAAWPQLEPNYGAAFRRLWHYYLAASIASFRSRRNHLYQFVLAPHRREGTYRSVR